MQIQLNGTQKIFPQSLNLNELIRSAGRANIPVIAELNGTIIPRGQWEALSLKEGDCIELVTLVGGG